MLPAPPVTAIRINDLVMVDPYGKKGQGPKGQKRPKGQLLHTRFFFFCGEKAHVTLMVFLRGNW